MGEQMAATPYTSCATGVPLGNGDTAPLAEPLAEAWGGVGCGGAASRSGESALSMHSIVRRRLTTAVGIGVSGNARSTSATESPNSRRRKGACGTAMPSCTLSDMRVICVCSSCPCSWWPAAVPTRAKSDALLSGACRHTAAAISM